MQEDQLVTQSTPFRSKNPFTGRLLSLTLSLQKQWCHGKGNPDADEEPSTMTKRGVIVLVFVPDYEESAWANSIKWCACTCACSERKRQPLLSVPPLSEERPKLVFLPVSRPQARFMLMT